MSKSGLAIASLLLLVVAPLRAAITGDYVEVRSADVYTGPCFANGEMGLTGDQAILAWHVRDGGFQGVPLAGLSVFAVVRASGTLGDTLHDPYPARSILIVDAQATPEQRAALAAFVKSVAGPLVSDVVRVESAPMVFQFGEGEDHGTVRLAAGKLAMIDTRPLQACDTICGNEETFYPPLTKLTHSMPAFTEEEGFSGRGLNVVWKRADKRSAFVGYFSY
ncbi:MAG: DUF1326 domain-containing protein [Terriglobales bacterium]